ncbi:hypothetical protein COO92_07635 [Thalassospira lohafexi]|uniref:Uncharacterized protein n=2 Tax=Thalassospira lohafexi TaxID=744227 RepID=A0A2N3L7P8_9PROT|nr:hypothetical protein COO92_07635 [Thalassospira lohafexi]
MRAYFFHIIKSVPLTSLIFLYFYIGVGNFWLGVFFGMIFFVVSLLYYLILFKVFTESLMSIAAIDVVLVVLVFAVFGFMISWYTFKFLLLAIFVQILSSVIVRLIFNRLKLQID